MNNEKRSLAYINILYTIIAIFFDSFFVLYFFKTVNYELLPLVKYYLIVYLFCGIGFILIRKPMKKNICVPYFRIGIALEATYIALIMLLKNNIGKYIIIVGIVKGLAEGFYYYPKNILETEKITNDERQKYSGIINTINQISSIIVPLIIGILLTYFKYIKVAKVFFYLFIIMFIITFNLKDNKYNDRLPSLKKFLKLLKDNKELRFSVYLPFTAGLTYSAGVMCLILTIANINTFKTNMNLGILESVCSILLLIVCILFTFIKKKHFKNIALLSSIISFIALILFSFNQNIIYLIIFLIIRNSFIALLNIITNYVSNNISNDERIKKDFKPEYYLLRDIMFMISRTIGYLLLLIIGYFFGINYIYYILIISAIFILIEGIIVNRILNNTCNT